MSMRKIVNKETGVDPVDYVGEFGGNCKFQLYALGEDGTKLQGNAINTQFNNTTKGFNP